MISFHFCRYKHYCDDVFVILEVEELIFELDPNNDGVITEDEFNVICKYISQRGNPSLPPIGGKSSTSRSD